jgi:hypothetical protein
MAGIFFLQNVFTSHPSRWIRIQSLTFGDCIVTPSMPIAHNTLPHTFGKRVTFNKEIILLGLTFVK